MSDVDGAGADENAARPAHLEDSVRIMASLHDEHVERLPPLGRALDRLTARAGRPGFVVALIILMTGWIALNLAVKFSGYRPLDPPPFSYLQAFATLLALGMTCLILSTQQREDDLSTRREQLNLEISHLAEQKAAKAIQLLQELRRDLPQVANMADADAESLAQPADPRVIRDAIEEALDASTAPTATSSPIQN